MANLVPGNMENIFLLLSQHNFTIINNDSDDFKCIICRRILSNACQAICGCHYCQKCVDDRVIGSEVFCPGITEECKTATLLNVMTNHKLNRQISQLVVRCPEEICGYESQIRTIGEHLRLCPRRSVECPFNDVGCDRGKLALDKLMEHLQHESLRHSQILIAVIGNLRNEVAELKRNGEKDRLDIDRLEKCDTEKKTIIESMRDEIQSIKLENTALERRMENILEGKCDKTSMEIDARCMREKIELIEEQLGDMRREWSGERERLAVVDVEEREKEKKYRKEMTERIDAVEKCLAENISKADCVMTIDNIAEARKNHREIYSEYFKGCAEPYKMRLWCQTIDDNEFRVRLFIYAGDSDGSLQWPFQRNVTVTITNQMNPKASKSINIYCKIAKPPNDSYKFSDAFSFQWKELIDGGVLQNDRFTVRCFINW